MGLMSEDLYDLVNACWTIKEHRPDDDWLDSLDILFFPWWERKEEELFRDVVEDIFGEEFAACFQRKLFDGQGRRQSLN